MARRNETTWFVVADGSRARILAPIQGKPDYRVVASYESQEAKLPSRELVSTPPGRAQESANPAQHAIEPRQDPHVARKAAFAREIADHLKVAGDRGDYDRLVLYADPRSLAVLREALDPVTRRRVKAEIPKDLTKVPVPELSRHFAADLLGEGSAHRRSD
jgi:protein required for attachment to host cells